MATTIRDYRIVKGMTREEAILNVAALWTGDPRTSPQSLVVRVQVPGEPSYQTYSYECRVFTAALDIIVNTYALAGPDALIRVEWL